MKTLKQIISFPLYAVCGIIGIICTSVLEFFTNVFEKLEEFNDD